MAKSAPGEASAVAPPDYPTSWVLDALLIDGEPVHVRPVRHDDGELLGAFHRNLTPTTVYYRYFGIHPMLSTDEVRHLVELDYRRRMAFAVLADDKLVGIGRYEWDGVDGTAELAFVVADAFQQRGVGTFLLDYLVAYGAEQGIARFTAEVLPGNPIMLRVFQASGLAVTEVRVDGVIRVQLDPRPTQEYLDRRGARERRSQAASMALLLRGARGRRARSRPTR